MPTSPPLVPVILSGGAGTRLWPLSREMAPKAFMRLADGETLLAKTAARALSLPGVDELVTVTDRELYFHTRDLYSGMGDRRPRNASFILEPFGRSTAPAVALAAMAVEARHGGDAIMLVLPADHLISDWTAFAAAVARAVALAREGSLVTFGIAPTRAETGYGYLECGEPLADVAGAPSAFRADRFVEKPDEDSAYEYLATENFLWNSGMFCFTASAILAAFDRHAGALLAAVRPCGDALRAGDGSMLEIDPGLFAPVPNISLDYAVMEPAATAGEVAIVSGTFDWTDVGSWEAVAELAPPDAQGNRGQGERVAIATRDTFVHAGDRVVATVGVENLAIIDTPGRPARCPSRFAAARARGRRGTQSAWPRSVSRAPHDGPAVGRIHGTARGSRLQGEADRGEAGRRDVPAAAPQTERALGRRRRHRDGDAWRRSLYRRHPRIDPHSGRNEASARKQGDRFRSSSSRCSAGIISAKTTSSGSRTGTGARNKGVRRRRQGRSGARAARSGP